MSLECLNCTLEICDDKSAECAFMIPIRAIKADWARRKYWTDPQAERDRVAQWQKENADKVREKQKRYYVRKKQRVVG